nr:immunoglobulin heavy chain junction region [Macaca mulatta]MOY25015.1 immunoglobulin heavy chain junction region [Macaca mulatta]MOY25259.1 immunoglobulin heavy chain junction region [Macaca mulatta]MOY28724.1 immunoglobulin heavy chain junction region [Macaca mulatta]
CARGPGCTDIYCDADGLDSW